MSDAGGLIARHRAENFVRHVLRHDLKQAVTLATIRRVAKKVLAQMERKHG